jgi:hypothetical protein
MFPWARFGGVSDGAKCTSVLPSGMVCISLRLSSTCEYVKKDADELKRKSDNCTPFFSYARPFKNGITLMSESLSGYTTPKGDQFGG